MWYVVLLGWDDSKQGKFPGKLKVWVTENTSGKNSGDKVYGHYESKSEADTVGNQLRRQYGCS
jgi:hypothetical protein